MKKLKEMLVNKEMLLREIGLLLLDLVIVIVSMAGALWIRFDFRFTDVEDVFWKTLQSYIHINLICTVFVFWAFRLYSSLWRFASIVELKNIIIATVLSTALQSMGMWYMKLSIPRLSLIHI